MALYLVTGAAGFIGSHLCETLLENGHRVRGIDNLSSGRRHNAPHSVDFIQGSINDPSALKAAMMGVDYVLHHAAIASVPASFADPMQTHHCNATGTLAVLEAARHAAVRAVIYAGSSSAYGDRGDDRLHEAMLPAPISPYGVSKLAGESYVSMYARSYGLPCLTLRYFNVYGPRQDATSAYSGVIARFISQLRQQATAEIFGDGLQSRDFVHVNDVARANMAACEQCNVDPDSVAGHVFNIGTGTETTLLELLRHVRRSTQTYTAPIMLPGRVGDVRRSVADITAAYTCLGWQPTINLAAGIQALIQT